jgi:hypothetical protein
MDARPFVELSAILYNNRGLSQVQMNPSGRLGYGSYSMTSSGGLPPSREM